MAIHQTFAGTHTGPLGGIAASGNRVTVLAMVIFRLADGKVAEVAFSWDLIEDFPVAVAQRARGGGSSRRLPIVSS